MIALKTAEIVNFLSFERKKERRRNRKKCTYHVLGDYLLIWYLQIGTLLHIRLNVYTNKQFNPITVYCTYVKTGK